MERIEYTRNDIAAQHIADYYGRTPVALVRSFGCQQSVNDGERLKGVLADIGFALTDQSVEADLILYNTCAVREHAEQRVFGNIGALKNLKAAKPGMLIGICGCMPEEPTVVEKIRKSYPYVDLVLGTNVADKLPELILQKLTGKKRVLPNGGVRQAVVEQLPTRRENSYKAFLPIMYGCDNFCSYCIVPFVRGRERSRAPGDILEEFRALVVEGYKEITLLGQNVNSYGKGLAQTLDFADLLALLCTEVPGDYKLRFMTSHPKDATSKLIDTMAQYPQICKHLHLPVQSGADNILATMNRGYTAAQYMALIAYAKKAVPEMTFSSDIIVGFPGETAEDFEKTVQLVRGVGYTQLFTFIYSKRTGTKAADMPDETPRSEKTARITQLLRLQDEMLPKLAEGWIGNTYTGLVEGPGREEGTQNARLDNNMVVEFAATGIPAGSFVPLQVTALRGAVLLGEAVQ